MIHKETHSVDDLMKMGQRILGRRQVHPQVTATLTQLQIEGTFATGTHLVTVENPIGTDDGDLEAALYGSFLAVPSFDMFPVMNQSDYEPMNLPGAVSTNDTGAIILYPGRKRIQLKVMNTGSRAVYVRSYQRFHILPSDLTPGWITLPFHGDQSCHAIRSTQKLRISYGRGFWELCTLQSAGADNRHPGRDWRPKNYPGWKRIRTWKDR